MTQVSDCDGVVTHGNQSSQHSRFVLRAVWLHACA